MHKPQQQVQDFHIAVTQQPTSPARPELRMAELRARLILEEAIETAEALVGTDATLALLKETPAWLKYREPSLIETIDGICDILYVTYGTAEAIGIDIEPFFDEVHRSNLAKAGGAMRADGKYLKPPSWTPPDIAGVLDRRRALSCAKCGAGPGERCDVGLHS